MFCNRRSLLDPFKPKNSSVTYPLKVSTVSDVEQLTKSSSGMLGEQVTKVLSRMLEEQVTKVLSRVPEEQVTKVLSRVLERASDKGLVQGARRASDKGLVQGARRASDKGLVQGARRAKTAKRAIAKVLRQVAKRASAGELSKDAMQNLKCANAKDEPAKSKGAGKTHASGTTGYATTEWLQQKEPWSHRGAPLPDSVALDIFDPKDASAPGHSVDELTG